MDRAPAKRAEELHGAPGKSSQRVLMFLQYLFVLPSYRTSPLTTHSLPHTWTWRGSTGRSTLDVVALDLVDVLLLHSERRDHDPEDLAEDLPQRLPSLSRPRLRRPAAAASAR